MSCAIANGGIGERLDMLIVLRYIIDGEQGGRYDYAAISEEKRRLKLSKQHHSNVL